MDCRATRLRTHQTGPSLLARESEQDLLHNQVVGALCMPVSICMASYLSSQPDWGLESWTIKRDSILGVLNCHSVVCGIDKRSQRPSLSEEDGARHLQNDYSA